MASNVQRGRRLLVRLALVLRIGGYLCGLAGVLLIGYNRLHGMQTQEGFGRWGYALIVVGFLSFATFYAMATILQLTRRRSIKPPPEN